MYYNVTIAAIRETIERTFPGTKAIFWDVSDNEVIMPSYLLWMCEQIEGMDPTSMEEAVKAARWIGWVLAHVELLGIWNNKKSRQVVREDHKFHHDRPRQQ